MTLGSLRNRRAGRLRTAEWRKNVAPDCAFPILQFFRHSADLSLWAALLRKLLIDCGQTSSDNSILLCTSSHKLRYGLSNCLKLVIVDRVRGHGLRSGFTPLQGINESENYFACLWDNNKKLIVSASFQIEPCFKRFLEHFWGELIRAN